MFKWLCVFISLWISQEAIAKKNIYDIKPPAKDTINLVNQQYENKQFEQAFKGYLSLAEYGDKFAQYRISQMYEKGQGVTQDKDLAYVWALMSKEDGNKYYLENYQRIKKQLSPEELKQARKKGSDDYEKYSNLGIALKLRSHLKKSLPLCTGSRIRGNTIACSQIQISCGDVNTGQTSGPECYQAAYLRTPEAINEIKQKIKKVNVYIEEEIERRSRVTVSEDEEAEK